uniref:PH domain-containing protein n=1 Tax=Macrostomum lignano TaxID=282301 RepID=A0A1I8IMF2_9PLAT
KSEPLEVMPLTDYTVDYVPEPPDDLPPDAAANRKLCFFSTVREGDHVTYATEDEAERQLWVQAVYRATGQTHKPEPPSQPAVRAASAQAQQKLSGEADRAKRAGLDEFIRVDPAQCDHAALFRRLQLLTLRHRLADPYTSLGWFSPGQVFVLDEYCARYGVRGCQRHVFYLEDLLDAADNGSIIDPALIHYSFAFCASHVHGNRPDGIGTVLHDERVRFEEVKKRLMELLLRHVTEFRYYFPFGRPEGALKGTLSLLERVLMKDIVTPADTEEVRKVVSGCLDEAATINYNRLADCANIEGKTRVRTPFIVSGSNRIVYILCKVTEIIQSDDPTEKKLEGIVHLAEMCIEVLQQNEEHHSEAFAWFSDLLVEHAENFWAKFAVDMMAVLESQPPDVWDSFPLFQLLNDYLRSDANLRNGRFHQQLRDTFAPHVVRYVDLMESSIAQSINRGFEKERWSQKGSGCATSEDLLWKLEALQSFIADLHWPDPPFAEHLDNRLKLMAADMLEAAGKRTSAAFEATMKRCGKGTDFLLPSDVCVMLNTCAGLKGSVLKLCTMRSGENMHEYHKKTDTFLDGVQSRIANGIVARFCEILEGVLIKLARYDETAMFSTLLSIAKPTDEMGKEFVDCCRANMEQLRHHIFDELLVLSICENWYSKQTRAIHDWLVKERAQAALHPYQLQCLCFIVRKVYSDFELQGVTHDVLDTRTYQALNSRLQAEEATQSMKMGEATGSPKPGPKSLLGSMAGSISSLGNGKLPTGGLSGITSSLSSFLPKSDQFHQNLSRKSSSHQNLSQKSSSHQNLSQKSSSHQNLSQKSSSNRNLSLEEQFPPEPQPEEQFQPEPQPEKQFQPEPQPRRASSSHRNLNQKSSSHWNLNQKSSSHRNLSQKSSSHRKLSQKSSSHTSARTVLNQKSSSHRNLSQKSSSHRKLSQKSRTFPPETQPEESEPSQPEESEEPQPEEPEEPQPEEPEEPQPVVHNLLDDENLLDFGHTKELTQQPDQPEVHQELRDEQPDVHHELRDEQPEVHQELSDEQPEQPEVQQELRDEQPEVHQETEQGQQEQHKQVSEEVLHEQQQPAELRRRDAEGRPSTLDRIINSPSTEFDSLDPDLAGLTDYREEALTAGLARAAHAEGDEEEEDDEEEEEVDEEESRDSLTALPSPPPPPPPLEATPLPLLGTRRPEG